MLLTMMTTVAISTLSIPIVGCHRQHTAWRNSLIKRRHPQTIFVLQKGGVVTQHPPHGIQCRIHLQCQWNIPIVLLYCSTATTTNTTLYSTQCTHTLSAICFSVCFSSVSVWNSKSLFGATFWQQANRLGNISKFKAHLMQPNAQFPPFRCRSSVPVLLFCHCKLSLFCNIT